MRYMYGNSNIYKNDISKFANKIIQKRLKEFKELGEKGYTIFNFKPFINLTLRSNLLTELLFCISTANSSAKSGIFFQKLLEDRDLNEDLHKGENQKLKDFIKESMLKSGVRFANRKSEYAELAIKNFDCVIEALDLEDFKAREYIVKHVKGLGFKESSHFLRNLGKTDLAILDRHILNWMLNNGYIDCIPKHLSERVYKKYERILINLAEDLNKNLAELDLILWFEITGKVLK